MNPETAAAIDDPTKNWNACKEGLLYLSQKPCLFSQVLLSAFLLPEVAQILYTMRYSLYQHNVSITPCRNTF